MRKLLPFIVLLFSVTTQAQIWTQEIRSTDPLFFRRPISETTQERTFKFEIFNSQDGLFHEKKLKKENEKALAQISQICNYNFKGYRIQDKDVIFNETMVSYEIEKSSCDVESQHPNNEGPWGHYPKESYRKVSLCTISGTVTCEKNESTAQLTNSDVAKAECERFSCFSLEK